MCLMPSANVVLSVCLPVVSFLLGRPSEKCTGTNIFFYLFPFSMFPSK